MAPIEQNGLLSRHQEMPWFIYTKVRGAQFSYVILFVSEKIKNRNERMKKSHERADFRGED